jgi:hypothetical protein
MASKRIWNSEIAVLIAVAEQSLGWLRLFLNGHPPVGDSKNLAGVVWHFAGTARHEVAYLWGDSYVQE